MGTVKLMTKIVLTGLITHAMGASAYAATTTTIISDRIVDLPVDISTTKMKLSAADYAMPVVKVLVPELADVTILDHRNTSEGAPCMATMDTFDPNDVIKGQPAVETSSFRIVLSRTATLLPDNRCEVFLEENLETQIRGFKFTHFRSVAVGQRHADDCR